MTLASMAKPFKIGDCELFTNDIPARATYAVCQVHDCVQLDRHATPREAVREFVCDNGEAWRFIIQYDDDPPVWVDLSGLVSRVQADQAAAHMGAYDGPPAKIYRWIRNGNIEPVTVSHVEGSGEWEPMPDDQGGRVAYPQYTITGALTGTEFYRVTVALDGDA